MSGPFEPAPGPRPDLVPDRDVELRRRQRGRATVMALLLGALVLLIFAITVAKIRAGMAH